MLGRRIFNLSMLGLGAALLLGLVAYKRIQIHSSDNHFVYQADAWLNGSLELKRRPHHQNDWASYETLELRGKSLEKHGTRVQGFFVHQSKKRHHFRTLQKNDIEIPKSDITNRSKSYFVSFPPGPALLMLPAVSIFGYGVNDVLFTVLFGGLNCLLAYLLLCRLGERFKSDRPSSDHLWLALFFTFSTCHFWLAVQGRVWFTALIVGATFHLLYVYFATGLRRPFLAGLCLSMAFASRATLVFSALYIVLEAISMRRERSPRELLKAITFFALPCAILGSTLLVLNFLRFDDPMEFGHTYLAGGNLQRIRDVGLFDTSFINRNISAMLTLAPKLSSTAPYISLSKHGMSILITSPALILLGWRGSRDRTFWRSLMVVGVILIPILLYQNTGWEQFSFRFLLDVLPLILVAFAAQRTRLHVSVKALIVVGNLINLFGAVTFQRPEFHHLYGEFLPLLPV